MLSRKSFVLLQKKLIYSQKHIAALYKSIQKYIEEKQKLSTPLLILNPTLKELEALFQVHQITLKYKKVFPRLQNAPAITISTILFRTFAYNKLCTYIKGQNISFILSQNATSDEPKAAIKTILSETKIALNIQQHPISSDLQQQFYNICMSSFNIDNEPYSQIFSYLYAISLGHIDIVKQLLIFIARCVLGINYTYIQSTSMPLTVIQTNNPTQIKTFVIELLNFFPHENKEFSAICGMNAIHSTRFPLSNDLTRPHLFDTISTYSLEQLKNRLIPGESTSSLLQDNIEGILVNISTDEISKSHLPIFVNCKLKLNIFLIKKYYQ